MKHFRVIETGGKDMISSLPYEVIMDKRLNHQRRPRSASPPSRAYEEFD
jgi:hypothetical protein